MKNKPNTQDGRKRLTSLKDLSEVAIAFPEREEAPPLHAREAEAELSRKHREEREEFVTPTHRLCSITGYLIGVEQTYFAREDIEAMDPAVFQELEQNRTARIFRSLCRLRNAFERHYMKIAQAFRYDFKNLYSIPDLVPKDALETLSAEGITFFHSQPNVNDYIVDVNQQINPRVRELQKLMPEWLRWDYLSPLFQMPGGTDLKRLKAIGEFYQSDPNRYPYHCWVNWDAVSIGRENRGNILWCDEKFVNLLYERHEDRFEDLSLVRDVGRSTQESIDRFLLRSRRCVFLVDCENSDPTKLAAALDSLTEQQKDHISGIVMVDSKYTSPEWQTMIDRLLRKSVYTGHNGAISVEHRMVNRLLDAKSQVDIDLTVEATIEICTNQTDSLVLVASDSDYWALIQRFPKVRFMLMMEREKSSTTILSALMQREIPYCFLDDFCTSSSYSIRSTTLVNLIQEQIDLILEGKAQMPMNLREMLEGILSHSWISLTTREKNEFCARYLDRPRLQIAPDGQILLTLEQPG